MKLGLATFIVPYMFWISPALLAQGPLPGILQAFATASLGVYLLACATERWMRNGPLPLHRWRNRVDGATKRCAGRVQARQNVSQMRVHNRSICPFGHSGIRGVTAGANSSRASSDNGI